MPQIKNTFLKSKMNKDLDARLLPNGEYRDAQNVSISKSEGADVGALENIKGNELSLKLLDASQSLGLKNPEIIGRFVDINRDRIFVFVTSFSDGSLDKLSNFSVGSNINSYIIMLDYSNTPSSSVLVQGNFLNLSKTHPIFGINVIEDLLFWTDNRNQPRKINIDKALADPNYYNSEDKISLAKYYPWSSIRLHTNENIVQRSTPTMKSKTEKWLPHTNSPVIMFPNQTSTVISSLNTHVPFGETTPVAGDYFYCYTYAQPSELAGSGWAAAGQTIFVRDGLQREYLPYYSDYNTQGDRRITGPNNPANNQLVAFYGSRTKDNKSIGKNNDCRLIQSQIVLGNVTHKQDNTKYSNVEIWKFQIWAPRENGAVNPDLTSLHNSLQETNYDEGNRPDIEKCKLFFHYPNPDYDASYTGNKEFLKDKFVRLSYRFKFEDNEYSLIAPFTQHIFIPSQFNHFMGEDINNTKKSLELSFMENMVDYANLFIDLPKDSSGNVLKANELKTKLKIKEIEVLYKSSVDETIKYIDSIDLDDYTNDNNTFINYEYNASEPIKTLPESEVTRVYDQTPVRAKAQESVGNRVVFGNFIDKNTYPESIVYTTEYSGKYKDKLYATSVSNPYIPSYSSREYPLHNLKNNRTYQVGFIFSDRYGRQSDVIVSSLDAYQDGDMGSTVFVPYARNNADTWDESWFAATNFGDSLKIKLLNYLTKDNLYSETNPLGWYSYKVVVKQQEQEYYNLYVPGIQSATTYAKGYKYDVGEDGSAVVPKTLDLVDFYFEAGRPRYQIEISGDNINKLPRSLNNVGPNDTNFAGSDVGLYTRVITTNWNTSFQFFQNVDDKIEADKVETIREFNTFNIETSDTVDITFTTDGGTKKYFPLNPIPKWDFYNGGNFITGSSSLLIATVSSVYSTDPGALWNTVDTGFTFDSNDDAGNKGAAKPNNSRWVRFGVIETAPVKSNLDIFWETSSTGLISDLNDSLDSSGGPLVTSILETVDSSFNWTSSAFLSSFQISENTPYFYNTTSNVWNISDYVQANDTSFNFGGSNYLAPGEEINVPMPSATTISNYSISINSLKVNNPFALVEAGKIQSDTGKDLMSYKLTGESNKVDSWPFDPGNATQVMDTTSIFGASSTFSSNIVNSSRVIRPMISYWYNDNASQPTLAFRDGYSYLPTAAGDLYTGLRKNSTPYNDLDGVASLGGEIAVMGRSYDNVGKVKINYDSSGSLDVGISTAKFSDLITKDFAGVFNPSNSNISDIFFTSGSYSSDSVHVSLSLVSVEYFSGGSWNSAPSSLFTLQSMGTAANGSFKYLMFTNSFATWNSTYYNKTFRIKFKLYTYENSTLLESQDVPLEIVMGQPTLQ